MPVGRAFRPFRESFSQRPSSAVVPRDSQPRQRQRRRHQLLLVAEAPEPAQLLQVGQEQHPANEKQKVILVRR